MPRLKGTTETQRSQRTGGDERGPGLKETEENSRSLEREVGGGRAECLLRRAEVALEDQDYLEADRLARLVVLEEVSNSTALLVRARACEALGRARSAALFFAQAGDVRQEPALYARAAQLYRQLGLEADADWCERQAAQ